MNHFDAHPPARKCLTPRAINGMMLLERMNEMLRRLGTKTASVSTRTGQMWNPESGYFRALNHGADQETRPVFAPEANTA